MTSQKFEHFLFSPPLLCYTLILSVLCPSVTLFTTPKLDLSKVQSSAVTIYVLLFNFQVNTGTILTVSLNEILEKLCHSIIWWVKPNNYKTGKGQYSSLKTLNLIHTKRAGRIGALEVLPNIMSVTYIYAPTCKLG